MIEAFREVYRTNAQAHEEGLSNDDRLALHQAESGPVMEKLQA